MPTECGNAPISNPRAHVTSNFPAGAVPTNDWWTSLLWRKFNCASVSENLMAHPLAFHAYTNGLGVSYPTTASISGTSTGVGEYHYNYAEDFRLGIAGLDADGKVDGYSDWTVSELWTNGSSSLRTTFGHGLPFVYATKTGGNATLTGAAAPTVWSNGNAAIGFTINGHDYAAFAPTGSTWSVSGSTISSSLNGGTFFSVAVLPTTPSSSTADRTAALTAYAPYAHNHVTGTKVSWSYNEATAKMTATYAFTTTARQGSGTGTVYALYPHQRDSLAGATLSGYSYVSPRGPMRVVVGSSQFQTVSTFNGVLPQLANTGFAAGSADATQLNGYIAQVASGDPFAGFGEDTYWTGKAFGRAAQVAQMANLTGNTTARDSLVGAMRTRLTDWMTASPGETTRSFWYNPSWGTLIGYPASYGSDTDLNDHHFHYGYYVVGAATVAQFDPSWAADSAYGGMVNTVIKDAANWDRTDTRFPFLRDFYIYAGHDWAAGHGAFGAGNNQESSSEGMNFASGLIQWGQVTGNKTVRDLGIYLYTTQASAIENYWFDTDDEAFPAAFGHSTVGMVWGDGGSYSTWFSAEPEMIQGINLLPSTAGHLYLGYNPSYISRNLAELERNNGGPATVWQDIIWEFQALADAPTALSQFRSQAGSYAVEEGESRAHTFYWLKNLSGLGTVDRSVTANTPLHAVFVKNGVRTYQAANMSGSAITVTFSNGVTLAVPARSVASSNSTAPTDTTAPTTPAYLTASGTTSTSTNLSWTASTDNVGVTGYEVLRNGSVVATATGTTYAASGLSANTTYSFAVRALDAAGNRSAGSTPLSVTTSAATGDTTAPSTPTGLAASGTTSSQTTLAWSASTDNVGVTGYEVLRGGTVIGSTASRTYTATGLSASTAYSFAVRAYDAAGNRSPASSAVSVTTAAASTGIDATSRI
ncbi:MAG TPA: glycosyl hydrolase, partial [Phytomonospora sp.]